MNGISTTNPSITDPSITNPSITDPSLSALLVRLRFGSHQMRCDAVQALVPFGSVTVPALIQALKSQTVLVSREAAKALGSIGDPRAIPALVEALEDAELGWRSAEALVKIGYPAAPALREVLKNKSVVRWVRYTAARALERIGDPQAVAAFIETLEDENRGKDSAETLARIGLPAVSALIGVLTNPDSRADWTVRYEAAEALGMTGDPQAVPALITALTEEGMGWEAVNALVQIGLPAVPALMQVLKDKEIGKEAARALVQIGFRAVPALIDALEEREISGQAARALGEIGGPQVVSALIAVLQEGDPAMHREAVQALGTLGDPQAVPVLVAVFKVKDEALSLEACRALRAIQDRRVVPALIEALSDKKRCLRVHGEAAEALGMIGNPQAVPVLVESLDHLDMGWNAVRALVQIGRPAVPALTEALCDMDKHWWARQSAAEALGGIGDPQAATALIKVLKAKKVGRAAAKALMKSAQHCPDPALRAALPTLHRLRTRSPIFQKALEEILVATAAFKDLPLPAAAPPPDANLLPRPAADADVSSSNFAAPAPGFWTACAGC